MSSQKWALIFRTIFRLWEQKCGKNNLTKSFNRIDTLRLKLQKNLILYTQINEFLKSEIIRDMLQQLSQTKYHRKYFNVFTFSSKSFISFSQHFENVGTRNKNFRLGTISTNTVWPAYFSTSFSINSNTQFNVRWEESSASNVCSLWVAADPTSLSVNNFSLRFSRITSSPQTNLKLYASTKLFTIVPFPDPGPPKTETLVSSSS